MLSGSSEIGLRKERTSLLPGGEPPDAMIQSIELATQDLKLLSSLSGDLSANDVGVA